MPRFAANLTTMYNEYPFLDRFKAAAGDGFKAVEFQFPYTEDIGALVAARRNAGVEVVLFNMPAGDLAAGERGIAALPGREREFASSLETALAYAAALGCPRLHCLAGIVEAGIGAGAPRRTFLANLRTAAKAARERDIDVLIEPINRRDMPGYALSFQQDACDLIAEAGMANLKLQMDFYHCQIMQGNLAYHFERNLPVIGHLQIASVPGRNEPDRGEVDYAFLFDLADRLGYAGWIGCEYGPRAGTSEGLAWLKPWR